MKTSRFSQAQRHEWKQEGFATLRPLSVTRWLGKLAKPLPQAPGDALTYGQEIIEKTPPPQKLQRPKMPFWLWLATVAVVSFVGWVSIWFCWGYWPR